MISFKVAHESRVGSLVEEQVANLVGSVKGFHVAFCRRALKQDHHGFDDLLLAVRDEKVLRSSIKSENKQRSTHAGAVGRARGGRRWRGWPIAR